MTSEKGATPKSWTIRLKQFLGLPFLISYAALLVVTEILHVWAPTFVTRHPDLKSSIDTVAEVAVMALLIAILGYLVMEHYTTLSRVPSEQSISLMILRMQDEVLSRVVKSTEVRVYATSEETYTEIKRTIDRINGTALGEKQMKHAMLHRSMDEGDPQTGLVQKRSSAAVPTYFSAFDAIMTDCICSKGRNRWFVKQFYNVSSLSRLAMIEDRLKLDAEGFEVKCGCIPDLYPCFSPLVVGEDDAFLATLDSKNNRVGTAIHLHGREATKFVATYFDILWAYQSFTLRDEQGVHRQELERLTELVRKRSQKRL